MENKKSNKGLIIFLIILVLGFACLSVLLYLGVIKVRTNETVKTNEKEVTEEKIVEKSSDERYKEYLENLSKSIENTFTEEYTNNETDFYTQREYIRNSDLIYSVELNKNHDLTLTFADTPFKGGSSKDIIAEKVVSFYFATVDNKLFNLYYITSDGDVFSVDIEKSLLNNSNYDIKKIELKNVIEVRQGSNSGEFYPIFIDIDGNVLTNN